jgi:hypothetical protein
MEAAIDAKLGEVAEKEPWWGEFVSAVQEHQVKLDGGGPEALALASLVPKNLLWAINTTFETFDTTGIIFYQLKVTFRL